VGRAFNAPEKDVAGLKEKQYEIRATSNENFLPFPILPNIISPAVAGF